MDRFIRKIRYSDKAGYLFLLPSFIILGLFLMYPVVWTFLISMRKVRPMEMQKAGLFDLPGEFVGLSNYIHAFQNELFIKSLVNTAYFGVVFVPLTIIGAVLLANYLNKKMRGVNFFRTVLFMPYIISVVSASLIFLFLFNGQQGLINAVIYKFGGIQGPDWLANSLLAMPVIAIMTVWKNLGYFMLIFLAGLQNIPNPLYEAADIDGANKIQKFRYVTWPLLGRITLVVVVLLLVDVFKVFQEVYVMTGGGPGNSTVTVPFLIYNEAFKYFRIGPAAAMSYILFIFIVIVTVLQKRYVDKRLG